MAATTPPDTAEPRTIADHEDVGHESPLPEEIVDVERTSSTLSKQDDQPPDGGYGWVCVACNFFINGKEEYSILIRHLLASGVDPSISGQSRWGRNLGFNVL
jgi:hypothetical protein